MTLPSPSKPALLGLESPIIAPALSPKGSKKSVDGTNSMEDQDNFSQLGLTSSSISEKHFEGNLTVDKIMESNILTKEPKWVAKGLLDLKEHK